ncbi:MAG: MerR family transcriptional regulator [Rubrivivax sp.]|nr:MerR family transcriptional regulator [Rubrivivax sp.]
METLPPIPPKRYFTIGEVSELCQVKPYVLRYWEQEFTQLKPMKRRGNRRYYQHHEVLLIRRIRTLLYDEGFTISGARNRLGDLGFGRSNGQAADPALAEAADEAMSDPGLETSAEAGSEAAPAAAPQSPLMLAEPGDAARLRTELEAIRRLLDA